MSVFICYPCKITIIDTRKGALPPCPSCKKPTVPKTGEGSMEVEFPDKPPRDSVFQLDLEKQPPVVDPLKPPDSKPKT